MRKAIVTLESNSANAPDVLYVIEQLISMAPKESRDVIEIEMQRAKEIGGATLYEEMLTDGSKVYCIQLQ